MPYTPNILHRHSIRLKGNYYSPVDMYQSGGKVGFVTIYVKDKDCLFGQIIASKKILNDTGIMVKNEWQ